MGMRGPAQGEGLRVSVARTRGWLWAGLEPQAEAQQPRAPR